MNIKENGCYKNRIDWVESESQTVEEFLYETSTIDFIHREVEGEEKEEVGISQYSSYFYILYIQNKWQQRDKRSWFRPCIILKSFMDKRQLLTHDEKSSNDKIFIYIHIIDRSAMVPSSIQRPSLVTYTTSNTVSNVVKYFATTIDSTLSLKPSLILYTFWHDV